MAEGAPEAFTGAWAYIVTGGGTAITALSAAVVTLWKRSNKLSDEQNAAVVAALNNNTAALRENTAASAKLADAVGKAMAEIAVMKSKLEDVDGNVDDIKAVIPAMSESMRIIAGKK